MPVNQAAYEEISKKVGAAGGTLVAVSKLQPVSAIRALYDLGHRDFGENYVQELLEKQKQLPEDIRWHFIGHLQTNKVKYILPFVHLIHAVDRLKLLSEINRLSLKEKRQTSVLLQVHVAAEETKFGFDEKELKNFISDKGAFEAFPACEIAGLMAMASNTDDEKQLESEFLGMKSLFEEARKLHPGMHILSMGMSGDYALALQTGSNMVRIGSSLFGARRTL